MGVGRVREGIGIGGEPHDEAERGFDLIGMSSSSLSDEKKSGSRFGVGRLQVFKDGWAACKGKGASGREVERGSA